MVESIRFISEESKRPNDMQKIIPHLWFDKQAKEAAEFYVSAFGNGSKINSITTLHDTPSGDVDTVMFELLGYSFMAIYNDGRFSRISEEGESGEFCPNRRPDSLGKRSAVL